MHISLNCFQYIDIALLLLFLFIQAVEFVMYVPNPSDYEEGLKLTEKKGFHFITVGAEGSYVILYK